MLCCLSCPRRWQEDGASVDPTKFVAKKSKAAAKKGVGNTQVGEGGAGVFLSACLAPSRRCTVACSNRRACCGAVAAREPGARHAGCAAPTAPLLAARPVQWDILKMSGIPEEEIAQVGGRLRRTTAVP